MFGNNQAADSTLLKTVNQRLQRSGGSSGGRLTAMVSHGAVTLTGMLQYEAERSPLVKAVSRISGVRSVVDQLRIKPKVTYPAYVPVVKDPVPKDAAAPVAEAAPTAPLDEGVAVE